MHYQLSLHGVMHFIIMSSFLKKIVVQIWPPDKSIWICLSLAMKIFFLCI